MKCRIDGCERPVKYKSIGLCHACYLRMYYWLKKTPREVIRRQRDLHIYDQTINEIFPKKVKSIRRKRAG